MQHKRAFLLATSFALVTVPVFIFYQGDTSAPWLPDCLFHKLTGLWCPGCGMTRATHAALHGHFGKAFRFNPVGMVLFPISLLGISMELAGWVRGKPPPVSLRLGRNGAWFILVVILAFWILRNIPTWPFNLLAPP